MSDVPAFAIKIDHNPFLPAGGREMHAVVTVEAEGEARPANASPKSAGADAAEIIIVDTSGSMSYSGKMAAAKRAAKAAVNVVRDGAYFAVIAGANAPRMVYPHTERLVQASERTRSGAASAIARLDAAGGTAIGTWLRLAHSLFGAHPRAIRHAILLTDGKNQHESADELDAALNACAGGFVLDARGVGTDWEVAELRKISSALLGGFLDVPDPKDLEADFRAMAEAAMGKEVADVLLRVWTPQNAELRFVKQMLPTVEDLTPRRVESGRQTGDYPIGAWGREDREYHVCVDVPPGDVGRQMRAAWLKLVVPDPDGAGERVLASGNVIAEWTDDEAKSTRINARVAHHTGQSELADAIQEGLEARREGDEDTATARLGRAVVLARRVGNEQISGLLDRVVDVVDAESGTVRLKQGVSKADEMSLDTRSVRTVRTHKGGATPAPEAGPADEAGPDRGAGS
ncbi:MULTISPECIES: VWA domain-containing protein [Actinomadura]|uniref:VWA domain-containing protein n=1 Tax=Actinomadura yumaensis TaxID=111807 RepID=A0ABW2CEV6_9ACTN|nr:VWA domain-containing protein [Actinomadura sp. J1-007]MWK35023.1 VWA domain-containing protein [Actinomadura sp. J1-007]